ncbi:MAG TPA: M15 family metallopeptidase [Chthoniobacterales bacterium]|nr:M15 family metallopeptidase [Chthoniobacterales bacterium]
MVSNLPDQYFRRIESIHQALQIPSNYGALRNLTPYLEASDLVPVEGYERQHYLAPYAARQWHAMKSAAAQDEIELWVISGFRSVDRQTEIIEGKLTQRMALHAILAVIAAPGFSQHHTGLAIDIGTPDHTALTEDFENSAAFRWLTSYAEKFGFVMPCTRDNPYGFIYEPWHWVLAR